MKEKKKEPPEKKKKLPGIEITELFMAKER